MKYLILILIVFSLLVGFTYAARFDWSGGKPVIVEDGVNTSRYDWSGGQPVIVFSPQPSASAFVLPDAKVRITAGTVTIQSGLVTIQ